MFGKWIQRGVLAAVATLLTATFSPGCTVDQESQLFIRQVLAPQAPDCSVEAEPDSPALGDGVLDSALSKEYTAWLLIGNQLIPRGSQDEARTETSKVTFRSAEVHVLSASTNQEISSYTVPISGFSDQALGQEAGYGVAKLPLIDKSAVDSLGSLGIDDRRRLVSRVKVTGHTLGGSDITSNEFQFVVQVCRGCLISFTSADQGDTDPNGNPVKGINCFGKGAASTTTGGACFPGQDQSISCQDCRSLPACQTPGGT